MFAYMQSKKLVEQYFYRCGVGKAYPSALTEGVGILSLLFLQAKCKKNCLIKVPSSMQWLTQALGLHKP